VRRLIVFLITLALVLVVADVGLRILSEYWVGGQFEQSLNLPGRPDVSISAVPYIPHLVTGDMPRVTVRTGTWTVKGVRFRSVSMALRRVHFSPRQLLYGRRSTIRADEGDGVAVIVALDATTTILGQEAKLHVTFRGTEALVRSSKLPHAVKGSVSLNGGRLVVVSDDPALGGLISLALPKLANGIRFQDVRVEDSQATMTFVLVKPQFKVTV
jgi:hypothetical protein